MLRSLLALALLAAPQSAPRLSPQESERLEAREVVLRNLTTEEGVETLVALIDVDAPPGTTLDAALDLPARAGDIGSLDSVTMYLETPALLGATYAMSVPGYSATFSILYQVDRAHGFVSYGLDESRENDLDSSNGSYQVYPRGVGSRLVYRVEVASGGAPVWLKRLVLGGSLPEQLEGIRARAEAVDG